MSHIVIPVHEQFDFKQTVLSHGWYMLAPFEWDTSTLTLYYTLQVTTGEVMRLSMTSHDDGIHIIADHPAPLSADMQADIRQAVRTIFNVDWDLKPFYNAMKAHEGYDWLEAERKGRILIAPTLWEDMAKVLFTTNTSWAQTIQMSARMCQLGKPHPTLTDVHAFPSVTTIAQMDFDHLHEQLRAGYRTAYLYELAQMIVAGAVDLEGWRELDSETLYRQVKALKGYGAYASGTIVRMLGHFDKLAIDSACREMYARLHNQGEKGTDPAIQAHYAHFGRWQGLVMWMDIMRR